MQWLETKQKVAFIPQWLVPNMKKGFTLISLCAILKFYLYSMQYCIQDLHSNSVNLIKIENSLCRIYNKILEGVWR